MAMARHIGRPPGAQQAAAPTTEWDSAFFVVVKPKRLIKY
jgi:hypothetical protein